MSPRRRLQGPLALLGLCLFGFLVFRIGFGELASSIRQMGLGFAALILVGGLSHLVKTWAWSFTLPLEFRVIPYWKMVGIRLAGEAVSQLSFAGQVVGETTRAIMMKPTIPLVAGVSSVVLDRIMFTLTGMLFAVAGVSFSLLVLPLPGELQRYSIWVVLLTSALLMLAMVAVRRRLPFLSGPLLLVRRAKGASSTVDTYLAAVQKVEATIQGFYRDARASFWKSLLLNVVGHGLAMAEVYLILWLLGLKVTLTTAFVIEALTKLVNLGGFLIPGNIGASEGGNMLILKSLGLGTASGLTLAVARRLRGLFWTAAGLTLLYTGALGVRGWRRPGT